LHIPTLVISITYEIDAWARTVLVLSVTLYCPREP
jgi:hypothetical protein